LPFAIDVDATPIARTNAINESQAVFLIAVLLFIEERKGHAVNAA